MHRIKPGQGAKNVERLTVQAGTYNGNGYEFWVEWQTQPDPLYDLCAGYYLHVLYEYIKIDRSLTELSTHWRIFKYGVWLGSTVEAAECNLPDAVVFTQSAFTRRFQERESLPPVEFTTG